jgi:hypothetical protein
VVPRVAEVKAFLANEPIAAKPLNMAPLASTGTVLENAIPVESISRNLLGSNIQHILDEVEQASDSESSVGMECERAGKATVGVEKEIRPRPLSLIDECHLVLIRTPEFTFVKPFALLLSNLLVCF